MTFVSLRAGCAPKTGAPDAQVSRATRLLLLVKRGLSRLRPGPPPVYLSEHYARDIGIEPGTGPLGRVPLPSQVWQVPRI